MKPYKKSRAHAPQKTTPWKVSAIALSLLCLFQTTSYAQTPNSDIKPKAIVIITPEGSWSDGTDESGGEFTCGTDKVMTGRKHSGDENEDTYYKCATVLQFETLKVTSRTWSDVVQEDDGVEYICPESTVMTGRKHSGDENGGTYYECGEIKDLWGNPLQIIQGPWSDEMTESSHEYQCPTNMVMTGRKHSGDENGKTKYLCATLW